MKRLLPPALAGLALAACLQPADEILSKSGQTGRLVFVKEPSIGIDRSIAMAANPDEFYRGTDLCLLSPISPDGKITNLTQTWTRSTADQDRWGAAADPEVSFDGTRILFSMRKAASSSWLIYELELETNTLTQLTQMSDFPPDCQALDNASDCNDIDPAYIDDQHIVFGSTRNRLVDEYERRSVPQLFVGERGGLGQRLTNVRQITFNQSHDQNPFVHSSGKIYFTRWDHLGSPNKMPLFTVNPDGTGQFVLYGADETFSGDGMTSGSRTFMEARELRDGGLVVSLMERTSEFEGGAIGIVDLSKFSSPPQMITPSTSPYNTSQHASDAIFKTPYPIMDGGKERILVAMSPKAAGSGVKDAQVNYDLYVMDKDGSNLKLVHADPNNNDYDPVVVEPRTLPYKPFAMNPAVQAAISQGAKTGKFFTADVYLRMDNDGHMKPDPAYVNADKTLGQAKFLRVLAAVSMPDGGMRGGELGRTEFEKQRLIGYADVRADGSFSIEVPANTPMHVQTLDENGMMLVNQLQWINVMPGEQRICTGCHGPRERDQDITHFAIQSDLTVKDTLRMAFNYLSGFQNAQNVAAHPSAHADTVDFIAPDSLHRTNTLQLIFNARCNSCHGAAVAAAQGGGLNLQNDTAYKASDMNRPLSSVYETLTSDSGYVTAQSGKKIRYASSDGARESPLAWVLFNKALGDGNAALFKTPSYDHSQMWAKDTTGRINAFDPKNADLMRLIEWMDMGTQFSNTVGY